MVEKHSNPQAHSGANLEEAITALRTILRGELLQPSDDSYDDARLIFALRHHEGLSCVQIARLLDKPEGTIYSKISRVHATIREALEVSE